MSDNDAVFVQNVRIPAEAIATTTLATCAVLLRFFSRWMKGLRYKNDDWMLAASMVSSALTNETVAGLLLTEADLPLRAPISPPDVYGPPHTLPLHKRPVTPSRSGILWTWNTNFIPNPGNAGQPQESEEQCPVSYLVSDGTRPFSHSNASTLPPYRQLRSPSFSCTSAPSTIIACEFPALCLAP